MNRRIYIDGFETNYFINDKGIVTNSSNEQLHYYISNSGYQRVTLFINHIRRKFSIHRLVAMTFIDDIPEGYVVNHKDGNKLNNDYKNLEIVTVKQNSEHASKNNLVQYGENHHKNKYSEKIVRKICVLIEKGISRKEIADKLNVPVKLVYNISLRVEWKRVSDEYNFPKIKRRKRYSDKDNEDILRLIKDGYKNDAIISLFGLNNKEDIKSMRWKLKRMRHESSTTIPTKSVFEIKYDF